MKFVSGVNLSFLFGTTPGCPRGKFRYGRYNDSNAAVYRIPDR